MIHGTSVVLTAHSVVKLRFLNQDCLLHREPLDSLVWSSAKVVWQHDWSENNPSRSVCKTHTHIRAYAHAHTLRFSLPWQWQSDFVRVIKAHVGRRRHAHWLGGGYSDFLSLWLRPGPAFLLGSQLWGYIKTADFSFWAAAGEIGYITELGRAGGLALFATV